MTVPLSGASRSRAGAKGRRRVFFVGEEHRVGAVCILHRTPSARGKALQASAPTPETVTLQPVLTATLNGGRVIVGWTRGSADALELYVDRGDGKGFTFLALDTVPDYIDTQALPATPAVWKYKAMYRQDDQPIGQWSAVISVGLGG